MTNDKFKKLAVWAITPNGLRLAEDIITSLPEAHLYASSNIEVKGVESVRFNRLSEILLKSFSRYDGHIFIMSTGIVVRMLAPLIHHKTHDPAVVVIDEKGNHAISLLSGHLGGANDLTKRISSIIGADPVITTATDVNELPAIDSLAADRGLFIENPEAIKYISMAFLKGDKIDLHDPYGLMDDGLSSQYIHKRSKNNQDMEIDRALNFIRENPGVFIDDQVTSLPEQVLILRPGSLTAGIGCNRNTPTKEIKELLFRVLDEYHLSANSLTQIGTVDLKSDEQGLLALSEKLGIPISFYSKEELNAIDTIKTPSDMVEKHIGVKSVCEAAAILTAEKGKLIVPKQSTRNVTVAIARTPFS